ncbi:putative odorant receptor 85d [Plodia interpunctella]|uniref:putative odorant receptor 85d n=1 Tax=Plodia interpunctella TaxID=58824 RepID=UPI0023689F0D|nr:putative odorant receptor 85d [Plodia interpunctella]
MFSKIKQRLCLIKKCLTENTCENLLKIVMTVPNLAGFSILKDKVAVPFWIIHISLLTYVYGVGSIVFQTVDAQNVGDLVQNFVSVSILFFTGNISYWFLRKRPLLKELVRKVREADQMARTAEFLLEKHERALGMIKIIILTFYFLNCSNALFVYIPARIDVSSQYSMRPCVGMPLNTSIGRHICQTILLAQELSIMTVVLNFQALLVLLVAHTATMYQMMAEEMISLASTEVIDSKQRLPFMIKRHVLLLSIVDNLKTLYSVPIGINFFGNAICICFFFYLPINSWLPFMPILVYCFVVFFLYNVLGQRLINATEVFERGIYACGWESFELKERRAVYVMLRQAQKPVELLAADIVPVNIYTFATTLQGMFKFVTVVKF